MMKLDLTCCTEGPVCLETWAQPSSKNVCPERGQISKVSHEMTAPCRDHTFSPLGEDTGPEESVCVITSSSYVA